MQDGTDDPEAAPRGLADAGVGGLSAAAWRRIGSACADACRRSTSELVRAITSARRAASRQSGAAACQIRSISSCHSLSLLSMGNTGAEWIQYAR